MIPYTLQGIPCQIEVTSYTIVAPWRGSAMTAPSDLDYYGYSEIEFELYDRKGYRARWLEKKLTDDDVAHIEALIKQQAGDNLDEAHY